MKKSEHTKKIAAILMATTALGITSLCSCEGGSSSDDNSTATTTAVQTKEKETETTTIEDTTLDIPELTTSEFNKYQTKYGIPSEIPEKGEDVAVVYGPPNFLE